MNFLQAITVAVKKDLEVTFEYNKDVDALAFCVLKVDKKKRTSMRYMISDLTLRKSPMAEEITVREFENVCGKVIHEHGRG